MSRKAPEIPLIYNRRDHGTGYGTVRRKTKVWVGKATLSACDYEGNLKQPQIMNMNLWFSLASDSAVELAWQQRLRTGTHLAAEENHI